MRHQEDTPQAPLSQWHLPEHDVLQLETRRDSSAREPRHVVRPRGSESEQECIAPYTAYLSVYARTCICVLGAPWRCTYRGVHCVYAATMLFTLWNE